MTKILYGQESCTSCSQAKKLLAMLPIDFMYQDVSAMPDYRGDIPMLLLEDGRQIIGLAQINVYVSAWKRENGFL